MKTKIIIVILSVVALGAVAFSATTLHRTRHEHAVVQQIKEAMPAARKAAKEANKSIDKYNDDLAVEEQIQADFDKCTAAVADDDIDAYNRCVTQSNAARKAAGLDS
jgi:hypothetical protein